MPLQFDLSELESFTEGFRTFFSPRVQTTIMTNVGKKVGAAAVRIAAEYPEPSRKPLPKVYNRVSVKGVTYQSKFKSQKQQGKVFVLAKEGKISYVRTGTLGKSMTSQVTEATPSSVTTEVGTNLSYAPDVIGENQNPYFAGTWMTLPEQMTTNSKKLSQVGVKAYMSEIEKRLK